MATRPTTDWLAWHGEYADPASSMSRRLAVVRGHIADWLDETAPRPVTVMSSCGGDGRDLLGVLAGRPDADRVTAHLLEYDERMVVTAGAFAEANGLAGVTVRRADAGQSEAYLGCVPADLVMLCGIFGNVTDEDVRRTVGAAAQFCAPDARVIWTRHHRPPDLTPRIREWFAAAGFAERAFTAPPEYVYSVGVHDLVARPEPLRTGERLFRFTR